MILDELISQLNLIECLLVGVVNFTVIRFKVIYAIKSNCFYRGFRIDKRNVKIRNIQKNLVLKFFLRFCVILFSIASQK